MATYNEIHPGNTSGENHNALYMIVGIILALVIAGFAFYYYADGNKSNFSDTSAGTVVERVIEPSSGSTNGSASTENNATKANSMNMSVDENGVSATSSTTQQ